MSVSTPGATPSRVLAVSPVQWMRVFAHTPESARVQSGDRHCVTAEEHYVPWSDEDALPTQCHREDDSDSESETHVHPLTVPAKRKRQSRGGEAPNSLSSGFLDCLSLTPVPSPRRHLKKMRSRARCTSPSEGNRHAYKQGSGPPHMPTLSARPRSRRAALDAVEIVSKKQSRGHTTDRWSCPTDTSRKIASSYYPSPPTRSRSPRESAAHVYTPGAPISHPNTVEHDGRASSESTSPFKTSKYFAPASASPMRPLEGHFSILTLPNSPMLTIPAHNESFDFEYPLLDESMHIPTWYNNASPFDDLMIMLRRLKPILVQGGRFVYTTTFNAESADFLAKQRP